MHRTVMHVAKKLHDFGFFGENVKDAILSSEVEYFDCNSLFVFVFRIDEFQLVVSNVWIKIKFFVE